MERAASVFRRGKQYFVHANAKTVDGAWIGSMPAVLLPAGASSEELGAAVAAALAGSRSGVRTPSRDEYRALHAPLLAAFKVKSWSALQRSAALCTVWQESGKLRIEPNRNGGNAGDERGFHALSDQCVTLRAEASPAEIGAALVSAFERCR